MRLNEPSLSKVVCAWCGPKQFAQYAGQLGLNPASFSQEHRAALNMGLNVRAKGYLTRSKIDELKQQGVSFDPNESGGQPLWNRMATEHLGRQSDARAMHPHGEHSHEATQRSNEVTHVHKHEGGEAIAQAAARLEKAMQGDSLHEFANVFGQHTTRLQTAIDKQSTQTGSNATATATQPAQPYLEKTLIIAVVGLPYSVSIRLVSIRRLNRSVDTSESLTTRLQR